MSREEKTKFSKRRLNKLLGIFSYVLPHKWKFIIGLILLFISSGAFLFFPYASGKLLDIAAGKENGWVVNDIGTVALLLLAVLFVQSFVSFFRVVLFARVTENAIANIRTDLYQKIITLPMVFYDQQRIGDLVSRTSNDVSQLQETISVTLAEFIRQVLILVIGITVIFFTAPALSVFMLAIFPVVVLGAVFFGRFIRKLSRQTQDEVARSNVIVEETMQAIHSVKSFTSELFEIARYAQSIRQVVTTALKAARFRAAFISFIIFSLFGAIVAVMWYGALLVQEGEMSVGDLLSFVLYTTFIGASLGALGDIFGKIIKASGASERILEILGEEAEPQEEDHEEEFRVQGAIEYRDVKFSYPTRPEFQVLNGINLKVESGKKVALVGQSGAGKSTVVQLLMRFYPVNEGVISIGGKDIRSVSLHQLRKNIGIVPQEILLFGGTIYENILYGRPGATFEEVKEAARKANAYDFIMDFPDGFETMVGERGIKLSGGQRQRIAIARAVLKDPAILILDEATSSLDAESEQLVQQALAELMKNRTTIIIAHRLATIRSVDKIYVLEDGKIIESGSHQDLLKTNGSYRNFVELQLN